MATSTLILDRSIPEVDAMVKNWKNGGVYTLEVEVRQTNSDEHKATFDVPVVTDMTEGMETEEAAPPSRPPKTMPTTPAYGEEM